VNVILNLSDASWISGGRRETWEENVNTHFVTFPRHPVMVASISGRGLEEEEDLAKKASSLFPKRVFVFRTDIHLHQCIICRKVN